MLELRQVHLMRLSVQPDLATNMAWATSGGKECIVMAVWLLWWVAWLLVQILLGYLSPGIRYRSAEQDYEAGWDAK